MRCPPLPEDDWALEAELRGMQRLLSSLKSRRPETAEYASESASLHFPQMGIPGWHARSGVEATADEELEPRWHGREAVPQHDTDSMLQQPRANWRRCKSSLYRRSRLEKLPRVSP